MNERRDFADEHTIVVVISATTSPSTCWPERGATPVLHALCNGQSCTAAETLERHQARPAPIAEAFCLCQLRSPASRSLTGPAKKEVPSGCMVNRGCKVSPATCIFNGDGAIVVDMGVIATYLSLDAHTPPSCRLPNSCYGDLTAGAYCARRHWGRGSTLRRPALLLGS